MLMSKVFMMIEASQSDIITLFKEHISMTSSTFPSTILIHILKFAIFKHLNGIREIPQKYVNIAKYF